MHHRHSLVLQALSRPRKGNVTTVTTVQGDVEAGFKEADHVIEYDLKLPAFASICLTLRLGGLVGRRSLSGEGKALHIEGAVRERQAISAMYKVPLEKTIQKGLFMGGKYCDWGLRKLGNHTAFSQKNRQTGTLCQ